MAALLPTFLSRANRGLGGVWPAVSESSPRRKIGPQTGIISEPCAGTLGPALIACITLNEGNCPLFRFAREVKSAGGIFSAGAAGPSPFPETPWQEAQYSENSCLPGSEEARLPGARFDGTACPSTKAGNSVAISADNILRFRTFLLLIFHPEGRSRILNLKNRLTLRIST